jgi:alkylhydroperoxidase/carboxymuconolactone decarboxylase family protein YurZ
MARPVVQSLVRPFGVVELEVMYAPGTRRHIKGSLKAGATPEEIMAVLHICVSMGIQACAKGVPILAEELERK